LPPCASSSTSVLRVNGRLTLSFAKFVTTSAGAGDVGPTVRDEVEGAFEE
jgi:hypothetical protein